MPKSIEKKLPPSTRVGRVLGRALLFSIPTIVISTLVQGYKEFRPELETQIKYCRLISKIKKEG